MSPWAYAAVFVFVMLLSSLAAVSSAAAYRAPADHCPASAPPAARYEPPPGWSVAFYRALAERRAGVEQPAAVTRALEAVAEVDRQIAAVISEMDAAVEAPPSDAGLEWCDDLLRRAKVLRAERQALEVRAGALADVHYSMREDR